MSRTDHHRNYRKRLRAYTGEIPVPRPAERAGEPEAPCTCGAITAINPCPYCQGERC